MRNTKLRLIVSCTSIIILLSACGPEKDRDNPFADLVWSQRLDSMGEIVAVHNDVIYAPRYPGLYVSYDKGMTWPSVRNYPKNSEYTVTKIRSLSICPGDTNVMLACGGGNDHMLKTSDGGWTWKTVLDSAYSDGENIAFNPQNPAQVFFLSLSTGKLWVSQDTGSTWQLRAFTGYRNSCTMSIHPENPNVMLAGAGDGRIIKSTDQGYHWYLVKDTTLFAETPRIMWDPANLELVYATITGFEDSHGMARSTNGGESWNLSGPGDLWGLEIMSTSRYVVVSSYTTTYISPDLGNKWFVLGNPTSGFWSIKSIGRRIFIVSEDHVLWSVDI